MCGAIYRHEVQAVAACSDGVILAPAITSAYQRSHGPRIGNRPSQSGKGDGLTWAQRDKQMTYGLFLELMFQSDNQYNPDDLNGFVGCWGPDPRPRGPTGGPRGENGAWHQMCGYF